MNGLGPFWFPDKARSKLTVWGSWFFDEAAWDKHDEGYAAGRPARWICDLRFFQAMLRDATQAETTQGTFCRAFTATIIWVAVRLGGWASYSSRDG